MRFILPAVVAFVAADATSAAPGRLREGGPDEDRHLQGETIQPVGGGFTDKGGKPPPARQDAPSYTMPDVSGRSASALSPKDRSVIITLNEKCAPGNEARCCADLARKHGTTVKNVWNKCRTCNLEKKDGRSAVSSFGGPNEPEVGSVMENMPVYAMEVNSWGLDRVNQKELPLDDQAEKVNAAGTRVYILDTGVRGSHDDFVGRMSTDASCHMNFSGDGGAHQTDGNGHGTHVASTACGLEYGVAENCEICAVQVLQASGSGSTIGVISGIEHVADTCPSGQTCVANLSLGGGASPPIDAAINAAVNAGMVMVVAAGNSDDDACKYSPARAENAITVGSTTKDEEASSFSNYGSCVDIYDPGSYITAAWIGDDGDTNTISGTSMASPHVAGIAAGAIGEGGATSPAEVRALLVANWGNPGIDTRAGAGDQGLATTFYGSLAPTVSPAPTQAPTPPIPCDGRIIDVKITTDNYPGETEWTFGDYGSEGPLSDANTLHEHSLCFDMSAKEFEITDAYGDGMCCSYGTGGYQILQGADLLKEGGSFASSDSWTLPAATLPPVAPTQPPVTPPTQPPVAPPTLGNPPAIVVAHAETFTFTPVSACLGAGALGASGTTAGQCAQACAVLEDCVGFEVFRTATDNFDEGDCVLSGAAACTPDNGAVWYYARSISD